MLDREFVPDKSNLHKVDLCVGFEYASGASIAGERPNEAQLIRFVQNVSLLPRLVLEASHCEPDGAIEGVYLVYHVDLIPIVRLQVVNDSVVVYEHL